MSLPKCKGCNAEFKPTRYLKLYCTNDCRNTTQKHKQEFFRPSDDLIAPDVAFRNKYLLMKTGKTA